MATLLYMTSRRWLSLPACALLLTACATTSQAPVQNKSEPLSKEPVVTLTAPPFASPVVEALRELVTQQDRLDRIAAPLLLNNPDLCKHQARNLLGFTAKNKYSYSSEYTDAAQGMFGLGESLQVIGVLAGSGAASAGVRRGDILLAVEERPLPQGQNAERATAAILLPLVGSRANVKLSLQRKGETLNVVVPLTRACAFRVELGNADNVNTYADGQRVMVTHGMLDFVKSDEELAYLIAKEMAHNALSHPAKQRLTGTVGGIIDNLIHVHPDLSMLIGSGGIKAMPQELDAAGDRLALYMLVRAGYNIDGCVAFWQRLAAQYPATVLNGHTAIHPSTAFRVTAMEKAIKEIRAKQAARKPLLP